MPREVSPCLGFWGVGVGGGHLGPWDALNKGVFVYLGRGPHSIV